MRMNNSIKIETGIQGGASLPTFSVYPCGCKNRAGEDVLLKIVLRLYVFSGQRVVIYHAVAEGHARDPDHIGLHGLGDAPGDDRADLEQRNLFVGDPEP